MRWQRGQDAVADQVQAGELVRIDNGAARSKELLAQARRGLALQAAALAGDEPDEAARLARIVIELCADAVLAAQDLGPSETGGRAAVAAAMTHQFTGEIRASPFDALQRVAPADGLATDRADEAIEAAKWAVAFTAQLLESGNLHPFVATG